jgi:hypothetical protein
MPLNVQPHEEIVNIRNDHQMRTQPPPETPLKKTHDRSAFIGSVANGPSVEAVG